MGLKMLVDESKGMVIYYVWGWSIWWGPTKKIGAECTEKRGGQKIVKRVPKRGAIMQNLGWTDKKFLFRKKILQPPLT